MPNSADEDPLRVVSLSSTDNNGGYIGVSAASEKRECFALFRLPRRRDPVVDSKGTILHSISAFKNLVYFPNATVTFGQVLVQTGDYFVTITINI